MTPVVREFTKGFWTDLAPFRIVLGLCPVLAVTTTAKNGLGMGLASTFVLTCSNLIVSLLRHTIPKKVRIAAFIVIIATFVVIVERSMQALYYPLFLELGIFIPLIVVNCIILGRAEAFASKNPVHLAFADGLGIGLGFTLSLFAIGSVREILGAGTFFGMTLFGNAFQPASFMVQPPGAFVCLGLMLGLMNLIRGTHK